MKRNRKRKKKPLHEIVILIYAWIVVVALYALSSGVSKYSVPHFNPDTHVSHFYIHADRHTGVFHATLGNMPAPSWRAAKVIDRALAVAREAQRELKQPLEQECTTFFQIADDKQLPLGMRVIISEQFAETPDSFCSATAQRVIIDSYAYIQTLRRETAGL